MTLGEKIAHQRRAMDYTQEQLAEVMGVSRQAVGKWEADTAYPETDKLRKMGKLFGCSMDYLLDDAASEKTGLGRSADEGGVPPVGKAGLEVRHIVGSILLTVGLLAVVLGVLFSMLLVLLGVGLAVCGGLCLAVKKHLWAWLLGFLVLALLLGGVFFGTLALNRYVTSHTVHTESVGEAESATVPSATLPG